MFFFNNWLLFYGVVEIYLENCRTVDAILM